MTKGYYHILVYALDVIFFIGAYFFINDTHQDVLYHIYLFFIINYVLGIYDFKNIRLLDFLLLSAFSIYIYFLWVSFYRYFFLKKPFFMDVTFLLIFFGVYMFYKFCSHRWVQLLKIKRKISLLFLYDSTLQKRSGIAKYISDIRKVPFYNLSKIIDVSEQKISKPIDYKLILEDNLCSTDFIKNMNIFSKAITFSSFAERNFYKMIISDGVYNDNIISIFSRKENFLDKLHYLFIFFINFLFVLLSSPLLLFFIMVIFVYNLFFSKGPLFYKQKRVGLHNKEFFVYKFRTMVVNAEKEGIKMAKQQDKRVTSLGKFLRKFRIDELPQIISIIEGNMNLIGPRPERKYYIKKISEKSFIYLLRHRIKPGITGWAQVQYKYGESIEDSIRKLEYDFYYIKHHSIFLDIRIILKTVQTILFSRGV